MRNAVRDTQRGPASQAIPRPPAAQKERRPLLKGLPRPLSDAQRAAMLDEAMRAIAERPDLSLPMKLRGIAPLAAARRRFQ